MKYMRIPPKYVVYPNASKTKKPCCDNWSKHESNFVCSIVLKGEKPH